MLTTTPEAVPAVRAWRAPPSGVWLLACALLALLGLFGWGRTPWARYLAQQSVAAHWARDALFLVDWALMSAAMMLPTALPLVNAVRRASAGLARHAQVVGACMLAFMAVWVGAGLVLRAVQMLVLDLWPQISVGAPGVFAATLLLGGSGTYLLLPLAQRCASACRSPFGFVARLWGGTGGAVRWGGRIGLAYGLSCLGCCWPLMLLMCALGLTDPLWMLAGVAVMLLQKHPRWAVPSTRGLGLILLLLASAVALGWLDLARVAPQWQSGGWGWCRSL